MGSAFTSEGEKSMKCSPFSLKDLPQRMINKIVIQDGCWVWTGSRNPKGYGSVSTGKHTSALAHRTTYEIANGAIPEGLQLDHTCLNTSCVNPAHLEPVTNAENMRRRFALQTHCVKGHLLAGDNLRFSTKRDGHTRRVCVACHREHTAAYRARVKERAA